MPTQTKTGRVVLDIETVSPGLGSDEYPDFDDPNDFELLGVGLAYQDQSGDVQRRECFLRDGWGDEAELDLFERALNWCRAYSPATIITYNGEEFDFPILEGRGDIALNPGYSNLPQDFRFFRQKIESDDLKPAVWDCYGEYTRLEDALNRTEGVEPIEVHHTEYEHGLEPDSWRKSSDRGKADVLSSDIPEFGEVYLDAVSNGKYESPQCRAIRELLHDYMVSDIEPLFELADARPLSA